VAIKTDNRLSLMDQAGLHLLRATGRGQLMQMLWIYEHPVDFDGLRRFHRNFGYGLAGRRIQRSLLPFGRSRWVSSLGPMSEIDFAEPRPRAEVSDWADERAQVPVDPEWGPGWHLGVLPMTDGSTAITLVGSHHLGDGSAALLSVVEAVHEAKRDLGYPLPRSRKRFRAAPGPVTRPVGGDVQFVVPAVTALVDLRQWDARANSLNGTSYSLVAGFAAKLGEHMGRRRADGNVALIIALNDRTSLDDTRATAMLFAKAQVDPSPVTTDLSDVRIVVRDALKMARETPDPTLKLLPLVPFVPKRVLKRVVERFLGSGAELPVSCSNLGDIHPSVGRPDGTEAEYIILRGVDQNVRRADIERAGGQLVVVAGRIGGKISIDIVAYRVGAENSKQKLRELAARTLAEFDLTGEIV
jgi:hypothetical protein